MTKFLRLTSLAPLFDVDCEIICSVSVGTVWHGFFSFDATLSQGGVGILGIFQGIFQIISLNSFHAIGLFLYLLKTSEDQNFSDIFKGYRKRPVAWIN